MQKSSLDLILLMPFLHLQDDVSLSEILLDWPQDEGAHTNYNLFYVAISSMSRKMPGNQSEPLLLLNVLN